MGIIKKYLLLYLIFYLFQAHVLPPVNPFVPTTTWHMNTKLIANGPLSLVIVLKLHPMVSSPREMAPSLQSWFISAVTKSKSKMAPSKSMAKIHLFKMESLTNILYPAKKSLKFSNGEAPSTFTLSWEFGWLQVCCSYIFDNIRGYKYYKFQFTYYLINIAFECKVWTIYYFFLFTDNNYVQVMPAPSVRGQHCGLCGNFNRYENTQIF